MWNDEKKLVPFDVELLEVNAMEGDAFQHKDEKVMRLAMGKTVPVRDFGRKVTKSWRHQADGKYAVLFIEAEE